MARRAWGTLWRELTENFKLQVKVKQLKTFHEYKSEENNSAISEMALKVNQIIFMIISFEKQYPK